MLQAMLGRSAHMEMGSRDDRVTSSLSPRSRAFGALYLPFRYSRTRHSGGGAEKASSSPTPSSGRRTVISSNQLTHILMIGHGLSFNLSFIFRIVLLSSFNTHKRFTCRKKVPRQWLQNTCQQQKKRVFDTQIAS